MDNVKLTYTRKEAAAVSNVSLPTIDNWLHMPGFPSFRVGTKWLIPCRELVEWLGEQANTKGA